jgi:hypothetical protein
MPVLRRLRGTFRETPAEFYSGDGVFLVLIVFIAPAVMMWIAVISEFRLPPTEPTHWYLLATLPILTIAAAFVARRAGTCVHLDGTAITIGSRYIKRVRIPFEDILETPLEKVELEYSTGTVLVIVTAARNHRIFLFGSLQRELPVA